MRRQRGANKKGVILVGPGYKYLSGISYYVAELGNQLHKETKTSIILIKNLCPKIIYPGKNRVGKHELKELNITKEIPVFDKLNWYLGLSFIKVLKFIKNQNPETIVLSWWTGTALHYYIILTLWCKLNNIKVFLEFHEVLDVGEAKIILVKPYVKLGLKFMQKLNVCGITHSSIDTKRIRSELGLTKMPIETVHHGPVNLINEVEKPVKIEKENKSLNKGSKLVNILYFGVIREYKGVDILLKAYKEILTEDKVDFDIHLTVAGEVWEGKDELNKLVKDIPSHKITFIDKYLDEIEVEKLFKKANLIVLPYRRSSASGPLHMAIASGLKTVTSDIPALVEASSKYQGVSYFAKGDVNDLQIKIIESLPKSFKSYQNPYTWENTRKTYLKTIKGKN
jgi:glycosyltransferase involved in cell wall biosynthesis